MSTAIDYAQPRRINWRLYRDVALMAFCLAAMSVKPNDEPKPTATKHEESNNGYLAQFYQ